MTWLHLDGESSGVPNSDWARVQQDIAARQVPVHNVHAVQVGHGIRQF